MIIKYGVSDSFKMLELSEQIAQKVDEIIYRILSGKYKLRKNGEFDMRFKENKGAKI